jgi:charged multivesicular body protein 2A
MTPQERLRKHQRALEKTQRELDRERVKLENQEKKLVQDIKKSAKNGQMGACKIQAKDLVRTRRYIQKFYQMRTQLQAVSLRIQTVRSNEQMMQSMKGATQLLGSMNRSMNLPALQRIAMEFEKENDIMDQRQEMMDDAIDDVTGLEDEEEGEEVVKEVLDEIGIDLGQAVCIFMIAREGSFLPRTLSLPSSPITLPSHSLMAKARLVFLAMRVMRMELEQWTWNPLLDYANT